jgi:hypothetical protein
MEFSPELQQQLIVGNPSELRLIVCNADIHANPGA